MKEILRILFAERKSTFWKVFLSVFLTGFLIASITEFYYYIHNEIKLMSEKTKVSVIFYNNTNKPDIKQIIKKLQQIPTINTIEYISSQQAEFEFFKGHPSFSKELLTVNPFPPVVNFTMKEDFFNFKDLRKITKKLDTNEFIEEIKYKKDFLIAFNSVKQNMFSFLYFMASIIFVLIVVIQYISIRYNYLNLPDKVSDRLLLGDDETKPLTLAKYKTTATIFLLIIILFSIFLTSIILFVLWWFLKDVVIWVDIMGIKRLLTSLFVTGGLMLYISILTAIVIRKKI